MSTFGGWMLEVAVNEQICSQCSIHLNIVAIYYTHPVLK
jgi:hypothetical protein